MERRNSAFSKLKCESENVSGHVCRPESGIYKAESASPGEATHLRTEAAQDKSAPAVVEHHKVDGRWIRVAPSSGSQSTATVGSSSQNAFPIEIKSDPLPENSDLPAAASKLQSTAAMGSSSLNAFYTKPRFNALPEDKDLPAAAIKLEPTAATESPSLSAFSLGPQSEARPEDSDLPAAASQLQPTAAMGSSPLNAFPAAPQFDALPKDTDLPAAAIKLQSTISTGNCFSNVFENEHSFASFPTGPQLLSVPSGPQSTASAASPNTLESAAPACMLTSPPSKRTVLTSPCRRPSLSSSLIRALTGPPLSYPTRNTLPRGHFAPGPAPSNAWIQPQRDKLQSSPFGHAALQAPGSQWTAALFPHYPPAFSYLPPSPHYNSYAPVAQTCPSQFVAPWQRPLVPWQELQGAPIYLPASSPLLTTLARAPQCLPAAQDTFQSQAAAYESASQMFAVASRSSLISSSATQQQTSTYFHEMSTFEESASFEQLTWCQQVIQPPNDQRHRLQEGTGTAQPVLSNSSSGRKRAAAPDTSIQVLNASKRICFEIRRKSRLSAELQQKLL